MAVICIDAELIDDLESVFAPVLDVDEGVVERCTVIADKGFAAPEGTGGFVNVRCDNFVEESLKLAVRKCDPVQGFELFPKVCLKRGSITDVRAIVILKVPQLGDEGLFKIAFGFSHRHRRVHRIFIFSGWVKFRGMKCKSNPRK